jgi:UDP-N-acetylglucosamine 2-epimerase (non-hydrolysing)
VRLVHVVGARPNYPKIAPLVRALASRHPGVENLVADTGQHYDHALAGGLAGALGLPPPAINLEVGSASRREQIARVRERFGAALAEVEPDLVVVAGDVNSTLGCALAAADEGIPLVHVEAGLRSFDPSMPEEENRVATDRLAALLLTHGAEADENLRAEGIAGIVRRAGNLMIDSLAAALPEALAAPGASGHALVTLHRPENVDDPAALARVCEALVAVAAEAPRTVFPVHPRTRRALAAAGLDARLAAAGVELAPPAGYLEFAALMARAACVLTDSGGVQEETTWLGVPCVTLRERTERPVTVTRGTNALAGRDPARILAAWRDAPARRRKVELEGWDGKAAERAADAIVELG